MANRSSLLTPVCTPYTVHQQVGSSEWWRGGMACVTRAIVESPYVHTARAIGQYGVRCSRGI